MPKYYMHTKETVSTKTLFYIEDLCSCKHFDRRTKSFCKTCTINLQMLLIIKIVYDP